MTSANRAQLPDASVRACIRDDLATSMLVEAAAGTGKTTALVGRLVSMVRRGACDLERVVVTVSTEEAAGRLTLRLREELERARESTPKGSERKACEEALCKLDAARIGTVHSLCADWLRERPVEAGVDPAFTVLDEDEVGLLVDRAIAEELEIALANPPEGLRRLLRRRTKNGETLATRIRPAARIAIELRDHGAPWRRDPFAREAEIDSVLQEMRALGEIAARAFRPDDAVVRSLAEIGRAVTEIDARERVVGRDDDGLEADLRELVAPWVRFWTWKGGSQQVAPGLSKTAVIARRDALRARIEAFLDAADRDVAAALRRDLEPIVERYEALKRRIGALDRLDLLLRTRDLLIRDAVVRQQLQQRFTHLFVDDAQDLDPIEVDIVLLLASDDPSVSDPAHARPVPGKLFVVGDPKQSIDRFRRASLASYERFKAQLANAGVPVLSLETSFRSLPDIQRVVHAAFDAPMREAESGVQAESVPLSTFRAPDMRRPSVVALPVPEPYGASGEISNDAIDASTPGAVAAFVEWLVRESGWTVVDPASREEVPIAPHHVCLLFGRTRAGGTDVVQPYVRALEARSIPHRWVGGRSFYERDETVALRALAAAIEYPDDTLSVYATLRGPFLGFTDAELLLFRHRAGLLHPMRREAVEGAARLDPALRPVSEALALLRELHFRRNRRPVADTFSEFFQRTRAHAVLSLWYGGEQRLACALRVLELARRYDRGGGLSFRGFVEMLEQWAERGEGCDGKPIPGGEGQSGVRVMTAHCAKGLEFPVVVLCDPTADSVEPTHGWKGWTDAARGEAYFAIADLEPVEVRERAEAVAALHRAETLRVAYLAATRARDLLVVPVVADRPIDAGWLAQLQRAIRPPPVGRRKSTFRAPGCPAFGEDATWARPQWVGGPPESAVPPGRHIWGQPPIDVVWWDSHALRLHVESGEGVRHDEVLRSIDGVDDGSKAHDAWSNRRFSAIENGAMPTLPAEPIRALACGAEALGATPRIERLPIPCRLHLRPRGRRIETLFRSTLRLLRAGDGDANLAAIVGARARMLGADCEEEAAVREALRALLSHRWLVGAQRIACPIAIRSGRGVVEGTIDLVCEEEGTLLAVRLLFCDGEPNDADRAEAAIAAEALAEVVGRPVSPAMLLV